jgi:hypothetical protein
MIMNTLLRCMFDTNVFNRILDGVIPLQTLSGRVVAHATHIQRDEINNTKNSERRTGLAQVFSDAVAESVSTDSFVLGVSRLGEARLGGKRVVPTSSAVWGVSRWDQANWGADDDVYSSLKADLDTMNRNKPNNVHDALIAEISVKGGYVLVTDDTDLAAVTKRYGGKCLSIAELLLQCTS